MSTQKMDFKKLEEKEMEGKKSDNIVALIKGAKIFKTKVEKQRIEHLITEGLEDNDISSYLDYRNTGKKYVDDKKFKDNFKEDFKNILEGEQGNLSDNIDKALDKLWESYFLTLTESQQRLFSGGGKRKSKRKSRKSHKKKRKSKRKSRKSRKFKKTKKRRR